MCVTVGNNFLKVPLLNAWMTDLTALSFTWNLKKHPFRADPPGIRHYREYPYNVTFGWLAVHVSRRNKHVITFALHALRKNKVFEGSTNQTMTKTYIIKDNLLRRQNFKKGPRNAWEIIVSAWERINIEFVCVSLTLNAWDLRALHRLSFKEDLQGVTKAVL